MLFHRLKKMLYLFIFFTLTAQAVDPDKTTFSTLKDHAVALTADASSGALLLAASLFACEAYVIGKVTINVYDERVNYYHLKAALGGFITAGYGSIALACLREAVFKLMVENLTF